MIGRLQCLTSSEKWHIQIGTGYLQSFELVLQEQWQRIHGVLYRLTGDPTEAEDLTLEAFWRFYQHGNNSPNFNSIGWIYRVAVNLGLNALRARKRRQGYEQEAGWQAAEASTAHDRSIEQDRLQQRRLVRLALARMKKRGSRLLMLRHSGLSYAEIANLLGISANSIGTMLARAEKDFEKHYRKLKGE
jgi:RNA polymerase sigma factor (sigma-70 family)